MKTTFKVFAVDDDPLVLDSITHIFAPDYDLSPFASAEECVARLESEKPDLFLLDVKLPGMDGYTLCRHIKDSPELRNSRVIFVSSSDTIEERIKGYDAGGEDFIAKPFAPEEILRKAKIAESLVLNQRTLAEQIAEAEHLSSLVMASMDETGILLQFMSKLIAMDSVAEISSGLLELMQRYRLDGVVQARIGGRTETLSAAGSNLPLEVSIIEHVRDQGRIFEFSRRSVHNFEHVTLMVNNLPLADPDFCGRLRDLLSVAAQGADSRLKAIQSDEANRRTQDGILSALESIGDTIMEVGEAHRENAAQSTQLINDLQQTLLDSFYRLGLTDNQEKFLQNMVGDFMARMAELLDRGAQTQNALQKLIGQLSLLRNS